MKKFATWHNDGTPQGRWEFEDWFVDEELAYWKALAEQRRKRVNHLCGWLAFVSLWLLAVSLIELIW